MVSSESSDRIVLVTGAGSGIGRGTAHAFAEAGYGVVVSDIDQEGADRTAAEIEERGGRALPRACDVRDAGDLRRLVADALQEFGRLDAAVNNAGIGTPNVTITEVTEEDWDRVLATDLKGVWLSMKAEIPAMLQLGAGAIVNIASIYGLVGTTWSSPAYVAAKHGVLGLTRAAALHYATGGIRCNAVCPGAIETPALAAKFALMEGSQAEDLAALHPMNRLGTPEEIASAAIWLCSPGAGFVTGVALPVDGGYVAA